MKILNYLSLICLAALLSYAALGLPCRDGSQDSFLEKDKSVTGTVAAYPYYVRNAYKETHTPNIVTAILADYRGFDTLGEETVIFTAGIICYLLMRRQRKSEKRN